MLTYSIKKPGHISWLHSHNIRVWGQGHNLFRCISLDANIRYEDGRLKKLGNVGMEISPFGYFSQKEIVFEEIPIHKYGVSIKELQMPIKKVEICSHNLLKIRCQYRS